MIRPNEGRKRSTELRKVEQKKEQEMRKGAEENKMQEEEVTRTEK
jgi:hypothetical protein